LADEFPYEYRVGRTMRILMLAIGYLFAAGGFACFVAPFFGRNSGESPMGMLIAGAVFSLLGAYAIASVRRTRVILHADSIEVRKMFSTKRLTRAEIAGRRGNPTRILLRAGKFLPLILPDEIKTDEKFEAWMADIADINLQEAQASLDAFLKEDDLAGSTEERLQGLNSARQVSKYLVWISLAAFLWALIYPHPYQVVILVLVALPCVALILAAVDGSAYRLDRKQHDVTADLTAPLMLPGFALVLRALLDVHVLDLTRVASLTAAAALGFIVAMVVFVSYMRRRTGALLLYLVLMLPYCAGVVVLANQQLDTSRPQRYAAQVLGSHISTGKHTSYYLELGPWGPRTAAESVDVGKDFYALGAQRETVCVWLFRGALGARWFTVADCPAD